MRPTHCPRGLTSIRGHHFLAEGLKEDSIVIDLGAHRGEFSAEVAKLFGCRCYAVEANPVLCDQITNTPRITSHNYAIAAEDRPVMFRIHDNPESSAIDNYSDQTGGALLQVQGITLASLLREIGRDSVDLLKVDIEGAEGELFASLSDEMLERFGQISIEFHDFVEALNMADQVEAIKRRLASLGFACVVFSRFNNGDVLFLNRRRCALSPVRWLYVTKIARYVKGIRRLAMRSVSAHPSRWRRGP